MNLKDLTSNARWTVRRAWAKGWIALTRPSITGHGDAVTVREPTADLTDLLAEGWQVVKQDKETEE